MHNTYKLSIVYFVFFSILLLASALMLFLTKIGFSVESITYYYLGNEEAFIQAKTITGLLKVVYPHSFAMGLLAMVLLHFIYFTYYKKQRIFLQLIFLTYLLIFIEIISPFILVLGIQLFAFIKLISFVLMFIVFFFLFWIILNSIIGQKTRKV